MARKKVSTTVYLEEHQVVALKELHQRTRVPIAEYIRMGIDMILQKNSDRLPGQLSLFEKDQVDIDSFRTPEDAKTSSKHMDD